jgi:hypothetical protein
VAVCTRRVFPEIQQLIFFLNREISVGRDHVIVLATGSEVPIFNAPAPLIVSRKRDKAIILETPRAPAENTPRQSPASEITNHVTSEVGDSSGAVEHHEGESSHAAADPVDVSVEVL